MPNVSSKKNRNLVGVSPDVAVPVETRSLVNPFSAVTSALLSQGESLAQLKRGGKERFKAAQKRIGKSLLHELADAWGYMIFQEVRPLGHVYSSIRCI